MSDDWLKKAEELREKNHPHSADETAKHKAQGKNFFHDNLPKVKQILTELGELWKSQDPNHPGLLMIGRHPGNDYYVYVNPMFENQVALYLFDKSNVDQKAFFTGSSTYGNQKVPGESLRIEFAEDYFNLQLPFSTDLPNYMEYSPKRVDSLDDLKAVIAELWAGGSIRISQ